MIVSCHFVCILHSINCIDIYIYSLNLFIYEKFIINITYLIEKHLLKYIYEQLFQ